MKIAGFIAQFPPPFSFTDPEKIIDAYKKGGAPSLDGNYAVFGQVIDGMSVVDKIASEEVTTNDSGENSKPVNPVKIVNIKILQEAK